MTKAELIRKISKNAGVPDTDAKIFFELFLKRISAIVDVGQSIFVNDFGYFHLIKGRIKKPVFSFKDNEISEEEIGLVLFSEDKDLRKSDTKGLVFNIPFFDEEDYNPIDSSFSLSIGKPLIPLRGVPFDNIYIPTSGYEYRRLIESKVEKIISASQIAESEENFPTLVIDARSYNSNQVQLHWDDKSLIETSEQIQQGTETKSELSDYEKQTKELKNIAWDFGEDFSRQIEANSILEITDERMKQDLNLKANSKKEPSINSEETTNSKQENSYAAGIILEKDIKEEPKLVEEKTNEYSSEKLDELLESEGKPAEPGEKELIIETSDDLNDEFIVDDVIEKVKPDDIENNKIEIEISDKEFWESTSKYFEPYKTETQNISEEEITEVKSAALNLGDFDLKGNSVLNITEPEGVSMDIENPIEDEITDRDGEEHKDEEENKVEDEDEVKNISEDDIELEKVIEQKPEFYQAEKKRNLNPFVVFLLLIIIASSALYWYLEFYKKDEIKIKSNQIALKSENAKVVARSFDLPVTYPYPPKVNQTTISETSTPKIGEQVVATEKIEDKNSEIKIPDKEQTAKEISGQKIINSKKPANVEIPTGTSLNVGGNIFKYGNIFVVQVASYRASSISENEAGKYRNKGYSAFVETAEIPNRGTWYRVRVGNFSTREEAIDFISKNLK